MLRNYVIIALRNIRKHKFYSILNISGLALGITSCMLIGLYVHEELTFDQIHNDYQNIYHVGLRLKSGGEEMILASTCAPLAGTMIKEIPGVEQATCLNRKKNIVLKYDNKAFTESNILQVDSNFFEFFSFKLLEGNSKTVVKEPNSIVLTTATAQRYFGNESPIGKIITVGNDNKAYTVTGIAEQAPNNSHLQYDALLSFEYDNHLWDIDPYTYYRKNPKTKLSSIEEGLSNIVTKYVASEIQNGFGVDYETFKKRGDVFLFFSYPLSSGHLYHPEIQYSIAASGEIKYVYMMSAVGLFILFIASINFMNLSTARSAGRAKEVGLRKAFGSARSKLIFQFLSESFIYVLTALLIAIAATYLLLPAFNLLTGKVLSFNTLFSPVMLGNMALVFVLVAIMSGSYPSFYLTSFNPIQVLKGNVRSGMKSKSIRSMLVIVQFTISIALVICTLLVHDQLQYMRQKNLGVDKQNVLLLKNTDRLGSNQNAFLQTVSNQAGIENASYISTEFPAMNSGGIVKPDGSNRDLVFLSYSADYNHADVLKMEIVQGRYFSKEFPTDSSGWVLNETAAKQLGLSDIANKKISFYGKPKPVIGVVKDFNFESLKSQVKPLIIHFKEKSNNILIRYTGDAKDAITTVETTWKHLSSNEPFEYTFLDQNFDKLFREEQRLGKLFVVMSTLAIFIACLGLLGLASFTAEQRTKEIGIRKVMGASVASVNILLGREFMILVGVSFLLASIVAWFAMNNWLSAFAYRITPGPLAFIISGIIAAIIACLTVSYHFTKAARSNPTDALRCE